jgi:chromosome segregation ATPase
MSGAPDITTHVKSINALIEKLAKAESKIEQYQISIGQHIKAIQTARPDDWLKIVKVECNLSRSRAYELMAIADGTKTAGQVRAAGAKRVREHEERKKNARPLANGRELEAQQAHIEELEAARERDNSLAEQLRLAEIKIKGLEGEIADLKDEIAGLKRENAGWRKAYPDRRPCFELQAAPIN